MKIVSVVFGGGISTLGMDVVVQSLKNAQCVEGLQISNFDPANPFLALSDCDVLLVSLYWFDNLLSYFSFLKKFGIDPRKKDGLKKPIIILGGVSAVNYKLLEGFFDFIVLGDGEVVLPDLIKAISKNEKFESPHVICRDVPVDKKSFAHSPVIPAYGYTENRGNQTTRIEIARGCKNKCPFCQLGHTKPYLEQPIEVVSTLLSRARSKAVGLFAPDRASYSHFEDLETLCKKWGKHNTAEDLRLDALGRIQSVSKLKFGIEGFTEATRKKIRKVSTNEKLIEGFRRIFFDLKKPNGKTHTTATAYMIGDLPGETPEDAVEFWEVLSKIDVFAKPPFTLFLTLNSFSPKPFTPWANEGSIRTTNGGLFGGRVLDSKTSLLRQGVECRGQRIESHTRLLQGETSGLPNYFSGWLTKGILCIKIRRPPRAFDLRNL